MGFCSTVFADGMTVEEFNLRLEQMEKENQMLRTQLLKSSSKANTPETKAETETIQHLASNPKLALSEKDLALAHTKEVAQKAELEGYGTGLSAWNISEDDVEKELARYKGWSWDKDHFTLTPYVWVWLTGTYETNRMFAGDFPLWVRNAENDPAAYIDIKPTRLGFNLACPEVSTLPGTKITAVLETDFENTYTAENKADLELRKAYIQLQNDRSMFLFGQTWELLGPLYPPTLNWGYGANSGNWAFRRPQIRYDRYYKRENGRLALQLNLLSSQTANFTESGTGTVYTGRFGSYPELQFRIERTFNETDFWKSAMFGLGAKVGEKEYVAAGEEFHRTSWGVVGESKIRFTDRLYWMGECWVGEMLAIHCSGVAQDLNVQTREKVGSTGGWMAFGWDLTPELHTTIGYSVDDPWDSRICKGMKAMNQFAFANISRDVTKQFNVGFEYEYCETEYYQIRHAHANLFMLNMVYKL